MTHSFPTRRSSDLIKDPDSPAPSDGHNEILVTDPAGKETWLTFTKTSPYTMQDPEGHTTTFQFEGGVPIYDPWAAYSFGSMLRERSEEHTSELQSLMRISYAVFCLTKKTITVPQRRSILSCYV